jgi:DNA-binding NarL/FixJ family response regulator
MPNLSILLIGDAARREFRAACDWLSALGPLQQAADVDSAAAILADPQATADVVVMAQAYPGQFSHADIQRLRDLAPLARIVALLGSWCEGEMRTGKPWPATVRTYWHQWPACAELELRRLAEGRCSAWALPVTATDEERLLADAEQPLPSGRGLIGIYSRNCAMADWLTASCQRCGYSTVWLRPPRRAQVRGATAVIYDGSGEWGEEYDELRQLVASLAPAPVIVLLDCPRIDDYDRARAAGAAAVLSKPLRLADLFWQLRAATK